MAKKTKKIGVIVYDRDSTTWEEAREEITPKYFKTLREAERWARKRVNTLMDHARESCSWKAVRV